MLQGNKAPHAVCIVIVIAALAVAAASMVLGGLQHRALNTPPEPTGKARITEHESPEERFPSVDWSHWHEVNPDIIGWVSVPGTSIDHPIVQAHPDDPGYYLNHDIYGSWNPFGSIYLDAECLAEGLDSRNSVIGGHSMDWAFDGIFGDIGRYGDPGFAQQHALILIQTPDWRKAFDVRFVDVIAGSEQSKLVRFDDEDQFMAWYGQQQENAQFTLAGEGGNEASSAPENVVTLYTCSYGSEDERTLVFAAEKR